MATLRDLDRIARKLPGVSRDEGDRVAYGVEAKPKPKGIAWSWKERVHPKKARVENRRVIAVRTASLSDKDMLLASDPDKFFTEPHYNGYPAVLVRLAAVTPKELEAVITAAWRAQAPKQLVAEYDHRAPRRSPRTRTAARR